MPELLARSLGSASRGSSHGGPCRLHLFEVSAKFFVLEKFVDELARQHPTRFGIARIMHTNDLSRMRDVARIGQKDVGKFRRQLAVDVGLNQEPPERPT